MGGSHALGERGGHAMGGGTAAYGMQQVQQGLAQGLANSRGQCDADYPMPAWNASAMLQGMQQGMQQNMQQGMASQHHAQVPSVEG